MIAPTTDAAALDELLEPLVRSLPPEAARRLVEFRADARTQSLIDSLATKANEGTLSEDEDQRYKSLVRAGTLIAILQAKARRALDQNPAP